MKSLENRVVPTMTLQKRAAFFCFFSLGAYHAFLTTAAPLDLPHRSPNTAASFFSVRVPHPAPAASGNGVATIAIAAAAAGHVGGAVLSGAIVYSHLLHENELVFSRLPYAAVVLRSLKAAITAAALDQAASLPLRSVALSPADQQTGEAMPPTSSENLLTRLVRQIPSIEIPTFSAVLSSCVDSIAAVLFSYFFPDGQLAHEALPPGAYIPLQKKTVSIGKSQSVGCERRGDYTDGPAEGISAPERGGAQGAIAEEVEKHITAPVPSGASSTAPPASALQQPPVPPRPIAPASCSTSNSSRCSSVPLDNGGREIFSSSSFGDKSANGAGSSDSFFANLSSSDSLAFLSYAAPTSPSRSTNTAQSLQVCTDTARQQGMCTSLTVSAAEKRFSSASIVRAGKDSEHFTSSLGAAGAALAADSADRSRSARTAAGAASIANPDGSQAQVVGAGEVDTLLGSPLSSSPAVSGVKAGEAASPLLRSASAANSRQQQSGVPGPGEENLAFGEVELRGNLFEKPRNANDSFFVDLSDMQGFLSSVDFFDPLLLVLVGFHLLLLAAVFFCRRVHVAQLLLMFFVSLLLLCSKQLLLLCSLVEQRLRTDDSLASAIATFFSSVPPSSPSTLSSSLSATRPQFYCSPSAAARATLFLLLFWWLPLLTALLLLVGTLLHELVASLRLLAMRKAKATKRRLRSGDETAAPGSSTLRLRSSQATPQQLD